jgi:hypothetical protein
MINYKKEHNERGYWLRVIGKNIELNCGIMDENYIDKIINYATEIQNAKMIKCKINVPIFSYTGIKTLEKEGYHLENTNIFLQKINNMWYLVDFPTGRLLVDFGSTRQKAIDSYLTNVDILQKVMNLNYENLTILNK